MHSQIRVLTEVAKKREIVVEMPDGRSPWMEVSSFERDRAHPNIRCHRARLGVVRFTLGMIRQQLTKGI